MTRRLLAIVILIGGAIYTSAQGSGSDVPEKIKAPAGEELVLRGHASGSQIYVCQAGADGKYDGRLHAADATQCGQQGKIIGHHFAGPSWKQKAGSEIKGKAVARVDAPDPDSIPWLLVTVTDRSGNGVLSRVTSIQRIHTKGGQPPPGGDCSAQKQ